MSGEVVVREWDLLTGPAQRFWEEHNACVTALRAALADAARLREALRERVFIYSKDGRAADWQMTECLACESKWPYREPESHAPGCLAILAALGQEEKS